jgi:hypothetical protein
MATAQTVQFFVCLGEGMLNFTEHKNTAFHDGAAVGQDAQTAAETIQERK